MNIGLPTDNKAMSKNHSIKGLLLFVLLIISANIVNAQESIKNELSLTQQQQSIVSISALTATGNIDQLKVELSKGLDAGLTVNEVKEILVHLYAYCGFPRSLNGITAFMSVMDNRKAKGITDTEGKTASPVNDPDKYQTGKKTLQMLTGREEKALTGANAFAPAIDTFLKEHLFADIFNRDVLTFKQRELVTVSALAAMSGVAPQLQAHIFIGINTGFTEPQLSEAFRIIDQIVGKNQGDIARATLEKVLTSKKQ
jgi:4-carboxymuconolactone decarboxylase